MQCRMFVLSYKILTHAVAYEADHMIQLPILALAFYFKEYQKQYKTSTYLTFKNICTLYIPLYKHITCKWSIIHLDVPCLGQWIMDTYILQN